MEARAATPQSLASICGTNDFLKFTIMFSFRFVMLFSQNTQEKEYFNLKW